MDSLSNKRSKTYGRVMPRVYNTAGHRSRTSLKSNSIVTRHETPTSINIGAKDCSSNLYSGSFRELPSVLHEYEPDTPLVKSRKLKYVVKPKKTLKSLDPSKSPILSKKLRPINKQDSKISVPNSAPCLTIPDPVSWSDIHYRQCLSSRSHTRLKELKDEIKTFQEDQKLNRLRSNLFKKCGVVLDEAGQVAADKAVQVEELDNTLRDIRYVTALFTKKYVTQKN